MAAHGKLVGLSQDHLVEIRDAAKQAIVAGLVRGVSYSIAGRSFSFSSISEASTMLLEANYALQLLQGTRSPNAVANFNPSLGRGAIGR
jgi:hypothetical protein